jgi:serine/threonine-protein kinase
MPPEQVVRILTAVAGALDYAHKQGLLHRDVKPANIMLTHVDEDGEQRVVLTDFGTARNLDDISGLTTTNMTVGTVAYSAPEQLMGEDIDGRADQYALAATTYHLLTGAQLFPHSNPAVVISRHLNSAPPTLADARAELAALDPALMKALDKHPANRYARCADFARALAGASSPRPARLLSPSAPTHPAPTQRRAAPSVTTHSAESSINSTPRPWLIPAVIAAVIVLVAGAILLWRPWSSRDELTATQANSSPVSTAAPTTTTPILSAPPTPSPPQREAPTTSIAATPTTTTVTNGATLGLACTDHDKIEFDPVSGQEIACRERFSPSYGWFWQQAPPTEGVHLRDTSCEGQHAWSGSRTPDGYLLHCLPADITSSSPIAGPGSLWRPPTNI